MAARLVLVVMALLAVASAQEYCYNRNGCTYTTGKGPTDTRSYKSPFAWGEVSETCLNGRSQSPINIRQQDITYRPDFDQIVLNYGNLEEPLEKANAPNAAPYTLAQPLTFPSAVGSESLWAWSPNPRTTPFATANDGAFTQYRRGSPHGIHIYVPSDVASNFRMSGGPLPEPSYNLQEIIFRLPAEHQVEGVTHSMEVQFIHAASNSATRETEYAVLAVLFQVGETESNWLKQFTDRPDPATRSYKAAFPTNNDAGFTFENPKLSNHAYGTFNDIFTNEVVCAEGRLCAIVDDTRNVAANSLVGELQESANANTRRRQLFEFASVSKIEARTLLKGSAFAITRALSSVSLGTYLSIEDAVLGETWRYAGKDAITFSTLLLGSEAPNDPREIVPFRFYKGSLSYPPCSENAWWVVTAVPQEMSVYQLGVFKKILGEAPNNRPVQNTNSRPVFSSWYKDDKEYYDMQYELNFNRLFQVKRGA